MLRAKNNLTKEEETIALELYASGMTWNEVSAAMEIKSYLLRQHVNFLKDTTGFKSRIGKKLHQTGANNDSWKGGRRVMSGYVAILNRKHPRARSNSGYVFEHVLVMEEYVGRYLIWQGRQHPDNEIVHHINGVRDDNRLENLVLMLSREHSYLHGNQKWAREILDSTNNIVYPNLKAACEVAELNENELATYIHFNWKRHGIIWKYATGQPITGLVIEQ